MKFNFLQLFFFGFLGAGLISGCRSLSPKERKNYYYFDHGVNENALPVYMVGEDKGATIAPKDPFAKIGDRISIKMLGFSSALDDVGKGAEEGDISGAAYLVDGEGTIALPILGKVRVMGFNRREIAKKLDTLYANYIVDPMVEVRILGHSVIVWGDSKAGGIIELKKDRVSLIEVLTQAGGISSLGKRSAIRVIRTGSNGKKEILIFDLTKIETLDQEELWLQDKDMILIEPKRVKVIADNLNPYLTLISMGTSLITIALVLFSILPKKQ